MSEKPKSELPPPDAPAAQAVNPLAAIDAVLDPFNRTDSPGAIVAFAQHGKLLYRRAVGMASLAHGVANTPNTRVRIASTSKHFTALAVLLLAEDGLLSLEDMAQKHLPELPTLSSNGPTLRQLMNHTGGWRGHDEIWAMSNGMVYHAPGLGMPAIVRQREMNFEPGTQMMYSNGGYFMLAKIVERVSGLDFNTFLKTRICIPLGMHDTESIATDVEVCHRVADRYIPLPEGGWRHGIYPCECEGGGSMVSTVDDMLIWLAHMRSSHKTVGNAHTWKEMMAETTLASGAKVSYGGGLARHDYRGVEIIHHAGAVIGSTSQMLTVPSHELDIIVLVNGAAIPTSPLALKVVELLLGETLQPNVVRARTSDFASLAGRHYYAADIGNVIGFADVGGMLGMSVQGAPAVPLRTDPGRLWLGLQELPLNDLEVDVTDLDPQRTPDSLKFHEGGQPRHLVLLPETPPDAATLAPQLCGEYHSADMDSSAEVEFKDGRLQVAIQGRYGRQVAAMNILSEDVVILYSLDPTLAKMGNLTLSIDRQDGKVVGMRLSSLRTRNLRLVRQEAQA